MNKEIVNISKSTTKLKVVNNVIKSVFKSVDTKTGFRLYDNNCIGIAGVIGKADEAALEKKAKDMLAFRIPYPVQPTKDVRRKVDLSDAFSITDKQLADITEELLAKLSKRYPDFSFTENVQLIETSESLKNDCGTDLVYRDKYVQFGFVIKHKKSLNMMDGFAMNITRGFDLDEAFAACTGSLDVYNNLVDSPEGEMPVIFTDDRLSSFFYQHLHGKMVAAGASLFTGKLGESLFNPAFSLSVNRSPKEFGTFFDGEGTVLADDKFALIEKGVLKSPYTSKKVAKENGFALTGSASMIFDSVPDVSPAGLDIDPSDKTIAQLVKGPAILVEMASGGDYTAQGEYSTPVQVAYLWENGKKIGRLPQIAVSGSVFNLFGDSFIGKSTDGPISSCPAIRYTAFNMNVKKIGGHM